MTPIKGLLAFALALCAAGSLVQSGPALADSSPEGLAESRLKSLDAATADIAAADRALKKVQEKQQKAVEPLPGERLGNVDGHSRLSPAYFERQRALAAEVDAARGRLVAAYRLRDQLRE